MNQFVHGVGPINHPGLLAGHGVRWLGVLAFVLLFMTPAQAESPDFAKIGTASPSPPRDNGKAITSNPPPSPTATGVDPADYRVTLSAAFNPNFYALKKEYGQWVENMYSGLLVGQPVGSGIQRFEDINYSGNHPVAGVIVVGKKDIEGVTAPYGTRLAFIAQIESTQPNGQVVVGPGGVQPRFERYYHFSERGAVGGVLSARNVLLAGVDRQAQPPGWSEVFRGFASQYNDEDAPAADLVIAWVATAYEPEEYDQQHFDQLHNNLRDPDFQQEPGSGWEYGALESISGQVYLSPDRVQSDQSAGKGFRVSFENGPVPKPSLVSKVTSNLELPEGMSPLNATLIAVAAVLGLILAVAGVAALFGSKRSYDF